MSKKEIKGIRRIRLKPYVHLSGTGVVKVYYGEDCSKKNFLGSLMLCLDCGGSVFIDISKDFNVVVKQIDYGASWGEWFYKGESK